MGVQTQPHLHLTKREGHPRQVLRTMARESGHPDFNPTLALLALFPSQFPHLSIKLLAWIGGFTQGFLGLWELQDYPGDTDAVESGGLGIGPHSALFSVLHIEPLCKLFLEEKVSWSKLKKKSLD